jgi:hypothetical protein
MEMTPIMPTAEQKFRKYFEFHWIFRTVSEFLFIYSTIFRGTPNDVWEEP